MEIFPCKECPERGICRVACARLHKFLREDKKCATRSHLKEVLLPPDMIQDLAGTTSLTGKTFMWHILTEGQIQYWDIEVAKHLTEGEKAMISAFYIDGLSYQQIADQFRISTRTVKRQLIKIKKHLRKVCTLRP